MGGSKSTRGGAGRQNEDNGVGDNWRLLRKVTLMGSVDGGCRLGCPIALPAPAARVQALRREGSEPRVPA